MTLGATRRTAQCATAAYRRRRRADVDGRCQHGRRRHRWRHVDTQRRLTAASRRMIIYAEIYSQCRTASPSAT